MLQDRSVIAFSGDFIIEFPDTNDFIFIFMTVTVAVAIRSLVNVIVKRILTLFFCSLYFFQLVLHRTERKM